MIKSQQADRDSPANAVIIKNFNRGDEQPMGVCFSCGAVLNAQTECGRGAECGSCGADVKVCLNCRFYDHASYNNCAEPNAERVVEKERSNFCDYFQLSGDGKKGQDRTKPDPMADLKKLFGDT